MSEDNKIAESAWNKVLDLSLKMPGARVDRESFLRSAFAPHIGKDTIDKAIESNPARAGIPAATLKRVAQASIKWHKAAVSSVSAIAGLPGNWWMLATIPTDLTQYFYHSAVISQKLAYIYGWPSLVEIQESGEIDEETKLTLMLFIGAMFGARMAQEGLTKLSFAIATQLTKNLPRAPLTKYAVYQIAEQVAKWVGVRMTKKKFAEWVGRAIPLIGGIVAGSVTWYLFSKGSGQLATHLESLPLARTESLINTGE